MAICFYCLDQQKNGEISFYETFAFFKNIYRGPSREKDIYNLLKLIDFDESGTYSLDEFFYISYVKLLSNKNRLQINMETIP
jgi:Ca2+-binding EF-hand superfamily protein